MPKAFVQCGDTASGSGDGGEAADGGTFADESFAVKHTGAGIVAMANAGGEFVKERSDASERRDGTGASDEREKGRGREGEIERERERGDVSER